ncbi:MAG: hypothetical protein AAB368_17075, partial [bacterium]
MRRGIGADSMGRVTMKTRVVIPRAGFHVVAAALWLAAGAAGAEEFRDGFDAGLPGRLPPAPWETTGFFWTVERGALRADGAEDSFAVVRGPAAAEGRIEARLTVRRVRGAGWKSAGLALYLGPDRFWRLALVESPGAATAGPKRFAELREQLDGVWGAEYESGTRLASAGATGSRACSFCSNFRSASRSGSSAGTTPKSSASRIPASNCSAWICGHLTVRTETTYLRRSWRASIKRRRPGSRLTR